MIVKEEEEDSSPVLFHCTPSCSSEVTTDSKFIINYENKITRGSEIPLDHLSLPRGKKPHYTQLVKNICPDKCEICGLPATGYHYEVGSCNGCKTFFRRTTLGQKEYLCRGRPRDKCFDQSDHKERVKCRACRLARCIQAGMNPAGIMAGIEGGRVETFHSTAVSKRNTTSLSDNEWPSSRDPSPKMRVTLTTAENTMDRLIDGLLYLEIAHQNLRKSIFNPKPHDGLSLADLLKGRSKLSMQLEEMPGWPLPPWVAPPDLKTIEEHIRLRKPMGAPSRRHSPPSSSTDSSPPSIPPDSPRPKRHLCHPNRKFWPHADLVFTVEYLKAFSFFHDFSESDKLSLARGMVHLSTNLTAAFYSYSRKSSITMFPDGGLPRNGEVHDSPFELLVHCRLISILKELQPDRKEYVLLKALLVCNPAIEDLSEGARRVLGEQHEIYAKSLLSYTMAARGIAKGPSSYAAMIGVVDSICHIAKKQKDMFILMRVLKLGYHPLDIPLMTEIFQL